MVSVPSAKELMHLSCFNLGVEVLIITTLVVFSCLEIALFIWSFNFVILTMAQASGRSFRNRENNTAIIS